MDRLKEDRQAEKQTDRHTDGLWDRQTGRLNVRHLDRLKEDRQAEKETDRHTDGLWDRQTGRLNVRHLDRPKEDRQPINRQTDIRTDCGTDRQAG